MKTKLFTLLILAITLNSCYVVKQTHSEVMDEMESLIKDGTITKDYIINRWGLPDQKRVEGPYEEWYYDLGTKSISVSSPSYTNSRVNAGPNNSVKVKSNTYGGETVTSITNKYTKFTFKNDKPIKFEAHGVNFTHREISTPLTLGYLLGLTIGVILCIPLL